MSATASPEAPSVDDQPSKPAELKYQAPHFNIEKQRLAERASAGDPAAFCEMAADLAAFLRGDKALDCASAYFWVDGLEALLAKERLWRKAAAEYSELSAQEVPIERRVTGHGPRVSEKTRRSIGAAFCRAFGLGKPEGRHHSRYEFLLTPQICWKIFELRLYGASLPLATKIVRSVYRSELSDRQIESWFRRAHWLKLPKDGTPGFFVGQHHRRLRLATHVLHRIARGMEPDQAYAEVARIAVVQLCRLPRAKLTLRPEAIKAAFDYARSCGDPTWARVDSFVRHAARTSRSVET